MAANEHEKVFVDWYLREGGVLTKQVSLPLSVQGPTWRTWTAKAVRPDVWVVVVRRRMLSGCSRCNFTIEEKPSRIAPSSQVSVELKKEIIPWEECRGPE